MSELTKYAKELRGAISEPWRWASYDGKDSPDMLFVEEAPVLIDRLVDEIEALEVGADNSKVLLKAASEQYDELALLLDRLKKEVQTIEECYDLARQATGGDSESMRLVIQRLNKVLGPWGGKS